MKFAFVQGKHLQEIKLAFFRKLPVGAIFGSSIFPNEHRVHRDDFISTFLIYVIFGHPFTGMNIQRMKLQAILFWCCLDLSFRTLTCNGNLKATSYGL